MRAIKSNRLVAGPVTWALAALLVGSASETLAASQRCDPAESFDEQRVGVGAFPHGIVAGDFDADGDLDLATPDMQSHQVSYVSQLVSGCQP